MVDLDNVDLARVEARIDTDRGRMVLGFRPDKAPATVRNFLTLARDGFYDGLAFHRVIRNFMVQGGCPHTRQGARGTPGTGGPGHRVHAEFNDFEHRRGVVSMARSQDPDSAGSQFFIVHAEHAGHLDGQYTAFAWVKEGLDVLDAIASADVQFNEQGERSTPAERIGIRRIELAEVDAPAEDGAGAEPARDAGDGAGEGAES